jgi:hypothetical protein
MPLMVPASAWIMQRLRAPRGHRIHHQRQRSDMIQVRMGQKDMVDAAHLVQRQVTDTGAGIDQDVAINQKGRGSAVFGDGAGTAQHTHFHGGPLFRLKIGGTVPFEVEWQQPHGGYTIRVEVIQVLFGIHSQQIQHQHDRIDPNPGRGRP